MKKRIRLGILFGILIFGISACGPKAAVNSKKEVLKEEQVQNEKQVDQQNFENMMKMLSQYEEGTAGASLKRIEAAFGVLNFSEKYENTQRDDLENKIRTYIRDHKDMNIEKLQMKLEGIEPTVKTVFSDGIESMEEQLEDAGNPNQYESYSQKKYEEVMSVFEAAFQ